MITLALAVCLLFDRRSARAIRALWDQLELRGVPSLRSHTHGRHVPHLSYAVLRSWDLASVAAALSGLDAGEPVDLSFEGIGLFRRSRVWLLAGTAADLAVRQERVAATVTAAGSCTQMSRGQRQARKEPPTTKPMNSRWTTRTRNQAAVVDTNSRTAVPGSALTWSV